MGTAILTLAAALIGSAVSLASVFVTQRYAQQVHRRDHERIERHRQEDLVRARAVRLIEERQAAYVRFSAATRTARDALAACMYDLQREGSLQTSRREALQECWSAYVAQHAEAHIIASDDVHGLIGQVNGTMRKIYGLVARLDVGPRNPGDNTQSLQERIDELWSGLVALREGMRHDLGLTPSADGQVP